MTFPINFTGHPADLGSPAGLTVEGLPVGLQIIGRRYADESVLALAEPLRTSKTWLQSYPGLTAPSTGRMTGIRGLSEARESEFDNAGQTKSTS